MAISAEFSNDEPISRGVMAVWRWMRASGEGDPDAIQRIDHGTGDVHQAPVEAHIVREGSADWVDRAWAASVAEPSYDVDGRMLVPGDDFAGLRLPEGVVIEPHDDHTLAVIYWPREQVAMLRAEQARRIAEGQGCLRAPSPWRSFGYRDTVDDT